MYRQAEQRFVRRCRNVHRLHAASSPADVANCELRQYCAELHLTVTKAASCRTASLLSYGPYDFRPQLSRVICLPPQQFVRAVRNWERRAFGCANSNQFETKLNLKTGSKPQKQSDNRDRQTEPDTSEVHFSLRSGKWVKEKTGTFYSFCIGDTNGTLCYAVSVKTDDFNDQTASQGPADNAATHAEVDNIKVGVRCCASRWRGLRRKRRKGAARVMADIIT